MAIAYSGVDCEHREVILKNKPEEMLLASPKGTVPVLIDCGKVIDESTDVMAWALEKADPADWLDHALDHELIQCNDQEFKFYLDRYKYFDRYPERTQSSYFDHALSFLERLESLMMVDNDVNYFLDSSKVTVLDIAIFPFVRQFAFVDKPKFDRLDLPRLQHWLAYFLDSNEFLRVMEKASAWTPRR